MLGEVSLLILAPTVNWKWKSLLLVAPIELLVAPIELLVALVVLWMAPIVLVRLAIIRHSMGSNMSLLALAPIICKEIWLEKVPRFWQNRIPIGRV